MYLTASKRNFEYAAHTRKRPTPLQPAARKKSTRTVKLIARPVRNRLLGAQTVRPDFLSRSRSISKELRNCPSTDRMTKKYRTSPRRAVAESRGVPTHRWWTWTCEIENWLSPTIASSQRPAIIDARLRVRWTNSCATTVLVLNRNPVDHAAPSLFSVESS